MKKDIGDFISGMSDLAEPRDGKRPWLRIALLAGGTLAFTVVLVLFILFLQSYLRKPLEGYAPYAYLAVFIATLLSTATVVLPAPGLAVVLAAAAKFNPFWVAVAASLGATLGESTAYFVGYWGSKAIVKRNIGIYNRAERWMRRHGMVAIVAVAFLPLMLFDFVGIAAGVLRFPFWRFLLAVYMGRLPRSLIEAYMGSGIINFFMSLVTR